MKVTYTIKPANNGTFFAFNVDGTCVETYGRAADARRGAARFSGNRGLKLIANWKTSDNGVSYAIA